VKLLVEWNNLFLALLSGLVGTFVSRLTVLALLVNLSEANASIELSDLVSVLARSRYLNRTSPVEVEMT